MNSLGQSFHFQQEDELCFQTLLVPQQSHQDQQHISSPCKLFGPSASSYQPITKRTLSSPATTDKVSADDDEGISGKRKKIIHRDVERQRRHGMAILYESLRLHLPLEYIKGKMSISDLMGEAANYIRHLQNKIRDLSYKRDRLRRDLVGDSDGVSDGLATRSVVVLVHPCDVGAEVVIRSGQREGILLSRVMEVLMEEGLGVVTCNLTSVNHVSIYTIQCEVKDRENVDFNVLHQNLVQCSLAPWIESGGNDMN